MGRKLLVIPIIHSEKEMGSLKSDISEMIDRKFGREKRDQHRKDVAIFWENLHILISDILSCVEGASLHVYQDGMPVGGEIGVKLVTLGAQDGIPNHQILLTIIERGGVLEKTEDPRLLKEEYEIVKAIVQAETDQERESLSERYKHRLYELTIERDQYISGRIAESLKEGMIGILFIGATHSVTQYLPPDIDFFVCNFVRNDVMEWLKGRNNPESLSPGRNRKEEDPCLREAGKQA